MTDLGRGLICQAVLVSLPGEKETDRQIKRERERERERRGGRENARKDGK